MAQLGGRLAMKHPVAVFAPADRPGPRQAAHGGGDALALRTDEVGEALVPERQRQCIDGVKQMPTIDPSLESSRATVWPHGSSRAG